MKRLALLASAVAVCCFGVASAKTAGPTPPQRILRKQTICILGKRGHHSGCVTFITVGLVAE